MVRVLLTTGSLPEGRETPTCASALWTTDWAGVGNVPVAAAAPVAVRASAGIAMTRAFAPKRVALVCLVSTAFFGAPCVCRTAATAVISESRRTTSSAVVGPFAACKSAATGA